MPNCYYVSSSGPEQTASDLRDCVSEVGGPGRIRKLQTDGKKVYALVYYREIVDAVKYLEPVKRCMEEKGHAVHDYRVIFDFEEVGLAVEGYEPDSDAAARP